MSAGFWINFNPAANNVLSNLGNVNQQVQQASQIMSTGNTVNSAADNPAAYAISQNMQMNSNGLNVAVQNAQQGSAMLQTATGAQQQVLGILQSMNQLATQAAQSGTQTVSDRAGLQLEMNSLAQEVNSITNQTQYNGLNILSGQFDSSGSVGGSTITLQVGADQGQTIAFNIKGTDVNSLSVAGTLADTVGTITKGTPTATGNATVTAANLESTVTLASNSILEAGTYAISFNGTYNAAGSMTSGTVQLQIQGADGTMENVGNAVSVTSGSSGTLTIGDSATGASLNIKLAGTYLNIATSTNGGTISQTDKVALTGTGTTSGSSSNNFQSSTNVVGLNVMTQSDAANAITSIHNAISQVTAQEEQLGAVQNRLTATVSDLNNTSSNLQTANSTIVGANMAQEQSKFAQAQVLEQAGISVLAQVNQQPSMLLKLLG